MTEVISWFCLVVIAKKRRIKREKDPDIWWEE